MFKRDLGVPTAISAGNWQYTTVMIMVNMAGIMGHAKVDAAAGDSEDKG